MAKISSLYNIITYESANFDGSDLIPISDGTESTYNITVLQLIGTQGWGLRATTASGIVAVDSSSSGVILTDANYSEYMENPLGVAGNKLYITSASVAQIGVSKFSGDDFDWSSASVIIKDSGINHDSTSGYDANRHIDHNLVSISPGTGLSGGGAITGNVTLNVVSASSPTNNTIAKMDSYGYLNNIVKDLVYLNVFDYGEGIVNGEAMIFRPPAAYFSSNRKVDAIGASINQYNSGSATITLSGGGISESIDVTSSGSFADTGITPFAIDTSASYLIEVSNADNISASGLDFWFTVIGS